MTSRYGTLDPGCLQIILIGPGFGESVIVGVPGERPGWLVVDSMVVGRGQALQQPVRDALNALGVLPDLVLLTHAHADHAGGMARLIEILPDTTRVAAVATDLSDAASARVRDAAARREAAAALAAIDGLPPSRRWGTVSEPEPLGGGTVTLLHPDPSAKGRLFKSPSAVPNLLSSPAVVRWGERRVLLGADLVRPEWSGLPGGLDGGEDPVKVPHHGSPGAFDPSWTGAPTHAVPSRTFLVTPFDRNPKLPDFDSVQSVPGLLARASTVHVTSLPFRARPQVTGAVGINALRAARDRAARHRRPLPGDLGPTRPARARAAAHQAWVRVQVDAAGACEVSAGSAALQVTA